MLSRSLKTMDESIVVGGTPHSSHERTGEEDLRVAFGIHTEQPISDSGQSVALKEEVIGELRIIDEPGCFPEDLIPELPGYSTVTFLKAGGTRRVHLAQFGKETRVIKLDKPSNSIE